jgi:hypothetical protein
VNYRTGSITSTVVMSSIFAVALLFFFKSL